MSDVKIGILSAYVEKNFKNVKIKKKSNTFIMKGAGILAFLISAVLGARLKVGQKSGPKTNFLHSQTLLT